MSHTTRLYGPGDLQASSHVFLPYVAAYEAVVRIIIGVGATVMMFDNIRARQHGFTALFGSIVLLFNPVLPAFALPRSETILLASILPFVGSMLWMRRPTHIGTPQAPILETIPQFD